MYIGQIWGPLRIAAVLLPLCCNKISYRAAVQPVRAPGARADGAFITEKIIVD